MSCKSKVSQTGKEGWGWFSGPFPVQIKCLNLITYEFGLSQLQCKQQCYINNSLYLVQKYARIFLHGHYLFWKAKGFLRVQLEENCEPWGTHNVQGQICQHSFVPKWKLHIMFVGLHIYFATLCGCESLYPEVMHVAAAGIWGGHRNGEGVVDWTL